MDFSAVERMQLKNAVERVLHVPGNYNGEQLEMAVVFDCNLPEEYAARIGKNIATLLKSCGEVFRNVRLNALRWVSDEILVKEISSLPQLQIGTYFESYKSTGKEEMKRIELLTEQLKKFYARSKIIILVTSGGYTAEDTELLKGSLRPFLYRKLIILNCGIDEESSAVKIEIEAGMKLLG